MSQAPEGKQLRMRLHIDPVRHPLLADLIPKYKPGQLAELLVDFAERHLELRRHLGSPIVGLPRTALADDGDHPTQPRKENEERLPEQPVFVSGANDAVVAETKPDIPSGLETLGFTSTDLDVFMNFRKS